MTVANAIKYRKSSLPDEGRQSRRRRRTCRHRATTAIFFPSRCSPPLQKVSTGVVRKCIVQSIRETYITNYETPRSRPEYPALEVAEDASRLRIESGRGWRTEKFPFQIITELSSRGLIIKIRPRSYIRVVSSFYASIL